MMYALEKSRHTSPSMSLSESILHESGPVTPCRILYVIGQLGGGGSERQICSLLEGMDRSYYWPHVAVWNFREHDVYVSRILELQVPIHGFSASQSRVAKLRTFRRLVKQLKPDVVHSYSFYTNFAAWWATRGTKSIAVGAVRSDFIKETTSSGVLLSSLSARWPRSQMYNSFIAAEKARHARTLFVPQQILVVRNGLDLGRFRNIPLSPNGSTRIVGIGSLLQLKRWERLLKAAVALRNRGLDFLIEIAGTGPLHKSLEGQTQALGLAGKVKFIGQVEDIPALLANSTFLAHTSDVEGCPNAVMEAMACSRAVVATDAGDVACLIDDGDTGFVVRRGDDEALVDRILRLITDRDLCRRMGEAGRSKAEREFGLDRLVAETLDSYRAFGWMDT
jgi:glycosyltransferase involved in cell wall biosynthesis